MMENFVAKRLGTTEEADLEAPHLGQSSTDTGELANQKGRVNDRSIDQWANWLILKLSLWVL